MYIIIRTVLQPRFDNSSSNDSLYLRSREPHYILLSTLTHTQARVVCARLTPFVGITIKFGLLYRIIKFYTYIMYICSVLLLSPSRSLFYY